MKVVSWFDNPEMESEQLYNESRLKKNIEISVRLKCISFALDSWQASKISLKLDVTRQTVCRWVSWYNDAGVDGLWDKKYKEAERRVSKAQESELRQIILDGPSKESGLAKFRGIDIVKIIREKYQTEYSLSSVYYMLGRMGLSYIKPRPLHPNQDSKRLEAW
jgi:transposase